MSLITQPADLPPPSALYGMLYGQPGSWKSSAALSAPKPLLLDFDMGLNRVLPEHRVPSVQVRNYEQILELLNSDELKPYETIVFDTAGKFIDRICEYVMQQDARNRTRAGQCTQQGWGEVKGLFIAMRKRFVLTNKSLIFVAHESEEKNGEETIKRPDIAGSARKLIVQDLDFMGYMELRGDRPVINFNPTDKFYAKNSLSLPPSLEVPILADGQPNNFLSKVIFKASDEKMAAQGELRKQYEALIKTIEKDVDAIKTTDQANKFYVGLAERPVIWDTVYFTRSLLKQKVDALGLTFDKEAKKFVSPAAAKATGKDSEEGNTSEKGVAKAKVGKKAAAAKVGVGKVEEQVSTLTDPKDATTDQKQAISDKDFSV